MLNDIIKIKKIYKYIINKNYEKLREFPDNLILSVKLLRNLDFKEDNKIYSIVRDKQSSFRNKLLKRYKNKCALTGQLEKVCEACHIIPFSECQDVFKKYDVNNGILLTRNLHKLYDQNLFYICENDCKIKINPKTAMEDILNYNLNDYKDKNIKELDNPKSKKYLEIRNNNYKNGV